MHRSALRRLLAQRRSSLPIAQRSLPSQTLASAPTLAPPSPHSRPASPSAKPPRLPAAPLPSSARSPNASSPPLVPPSPSTAHGLPLPGGNSPTSRAASLQRLLASWRRLPAAPHAAWDPRDVAPLSPHTTFVGVGLRTNWRALQAAMQCAVFTGGGPEQDLLQSRVVAIRDVFDRDESRVCLEDYFAVVADDVVAVLRDVVRSGPTTRRFVNVYAPISEIGTGEVEYKMVRNDVDLIQYLHSSGLRVIPVATKSDLDALRDGNTPIPPQQSTNHVLACAPTAFSYNASAAADNHFMPAPSTPPPVAPLRRAVLTEFAHLHAALTDRAKGAGAHVHLFTHEDWHDTPDACFPNNTFSTHTNLETRAPSCALVLYPMRAPSRRRERRLVQRLLSLGRYTQVYDLTREEEAANPAFLEGTGSLVLDRVNRVAYVALSARSDLRLAKTWARLMDYTIIPFTALDRAGRPIYHTNVMMSVGSNVAVVCSSCIADERERARVLDALQATGHAIVDISYEQVESFCGNVLELESFYGEQVMVMSTGAHNSFTDSQRAKLLEHTAKLVHADIPTIERVGGGGVRCTIAELH